MILHINFLDITRLFHYWLLGGW